MTEKTKTKTKPILVNGQIVGHLHESAADKPLKLREKLLSKVSEEKPINVTTPSDTESKTALRRGKPKFFDKYFWISATAATAASFILLYGSKVFAQTADASDLPARPTFAQTGPQSKGPPPHQRLNMVPAYRPDGFNG